MKSIHGVLKEEVARLVATEKSYRREIKKLPKGSLQIKRIKDILYSYLALREGDKVVYQYLGRLSENEMKQWNEQISLRRKYESQLREVKRSQIKIAKMIHGKRRSI